jgi:hypothetical protein
MDARILARAAGQVAPSRREAEVLSRIGDSHALWRLEKGGTTSPLTSYQAERASVRTASALEGQLTEIPETRLEVFAVEARKAGREKL